MLRVEKRVAAWDVANSDSYRAPMTVRYKSHVRDGSIVVPAGRNNNEPRVYYLCAQDLVVFKQVFGRDITDNYRSRKSIEDTIMVLRGERAARASNAMTPMRQIAQICKKMPDKLTQFRQMNGEQWLYDPYFFQYQENLAAHGPPEKFLDATGRFMMWLYGDFNIKRLRRTKTTGPHSNRGIKIGRRKRYIPANTNIRATSNR